MVSWQIIESGQLSPDVIMAKDADLLQQLNEKSLPVLHFYEWDRPCLTYGYFTDPSYALDLPNMEKYGLHMARRPTGGGIIFHLSDLAFSVIIPAHDPHFSLNTLENYAFINQNVAEVVARFSHQKIHPHLFDAKSSCLNQHCYPFCMAKPTQYDLVIEGKKVGGAAQRRTKLGFLHQASLSLVFPPLKLLGQVLKNHLMVLSAMQTNTFCLLPEHSTALEVNQARCKLKGLLVEQFVQKNIVD